MEFLAQNWMELGAGLGAVLLALVVVLKLVPGDQGEGILERLGNLLIKLGKK